MAVTDPKAWSTESDRELAIAIEKCIQLYMDRDETAHAVEIHTGIDRQITQMVWDRMKEQDQVFFQYYYIRVALKRQILRFNQLLEQQRRAMNFLPVPAEQQMSMELAEETAPQNDSPVSGTDYKNEAGSEEVAGSAPHLVPGGSLAHSSREALGMRINAALDSAKRSISQVPNHIAGGHYAGNFGGPFQPSSTSMAQSSSHLDSNPEASAQEGLANLALDEGSPSADL